MIQPRMTLVVASCAVLAAGVVAYLLVVRSPGAVRPGAVQNIILISVDTLRADHLGSYGYGRPTSPNVDRLGEGGVVFLNTIAQSPSTLPSHASIFTSRYASQHRAIKDGMSYTELDEAEQTLAEILKANGYRTAAFTDGGETAKIFNLDQGFDIYDDQGGGIERINARAVKWLAANAGHKLFLFVHCYDTHAPYEPPAPYDRLFPEQALKVDLHKKDPTPQDEEVFLKKSIADYDAEITYTDKHVGALVGHVDRLGLRGKTLIIFTSDHGEEFLEHKRLGHSEHVYDESVKVPLVFHGAGIPGARKVATQVSTVDITPTVLDILRLPIPGRMMGHSLLGLMRGDAELERPAFTENEHRTQYAIRTSSNKLIVDSEKSRHLLFDLRQDPGEQRGLEPAGAPGYGALLKRLKRWKRDVSETAARERPARSLAAEPARNKRVIEQLRSLGYIE